ncbi:MAG: tetratricopeptide repeat protein [Candidatus Eisenbacteria bacterium]|nr:tetratricopeptide repeat protein [Candidatus Eisenbacteria bacterium]
MSDPGILILLLLAVFLAVAIYSLSRKKKAKPAESESPYTKALNCLISGSNDDALRFLKETVHRDSQNIDAYLKLGDLLRKQGQVEKATQIHRDLTVRPLADGKLKEAVYESLVEDFVASAKYPSAILAGEKVLDLNKKNVKVLKLLGRVYENLKQWDKACEIEEELEKLSGSKEPGRLALYKSWIGRDLLRRKRIREAKKAFKDALRLDGDCVPAFLYLGDIYREDGRIDRAITLWKGIASRFPGMAYIVFDRLEKALFEKGRFGEMMEFYEELAQRNPKDSSTLLSLATLQKKRGDKNEALRLVREVLEFEPENERARAELIMLYHEDGRNDDAYREAAKLAEKLKKENEKYRCRNCGNRSDEPLWRCPSCLQWDTYLE